MTTVTLPDGTAARLAPRTKMRVPGEEGGTDQIEVWLDGRAFFGVDPTSERGFAVRTPHGEATALGTRFEVRSEERALEVLVVEGSVQLLAGDSRVELAESQLGTISGDAPPEITTVDHVAPRLDWMGASLVFRETPLERVLEEIEHRYDKEVVLEDDELGGRTVTATFTDQRLEEIAIVVCEIAALHCAMQGDVLRVTGLED